MLTVVTDEGGEGYAFGGRPEIVEHVKTVLLGDDPLYRERLWQLLRRTQRIGNLTDQDISVVDLALWDLTGRYLGQPVHRLLGGYPHMVLAYASTMCGDEMPGGLSTPEEYARFAEWCMDRGYKAIKFHTWMPPI